MQLMWLQIYSSGDGEGLRSLNRRLSYESIRGLLDWLSGSVVSRPCNGSSKGLDPFASDETYKIPHAAFRKLIVWDEVSVAFSLLPFAPTDLELTRKFRCVGRCFEYFRPDRIHHLPRFIRKDESALEFQDPQFSVRTRAPMGLVVSDAHAYLITCHRTRLF